MHVIDLLQNEALSSSGSPLVTSSSRKEADRGEVEKDKRRKKRRERDEPRR